MMNRLSAKRILSTASVMVLNGDATAYEDAIKLAIEALSQPERPKGRWEEDEDYFGSAVYKCTACGEEWILNCGTPAENNMNFCPNCGADMRGEEE